MVWYNYIRFLYFNQHKSQRDTTKELGIHRSTVKRAIMNSEQKYLLTSERNKSVNNDIEKIIRKWIEYNSNQPKNQKLIKKRM